MSIIQHENLQETYVMLPVEGTLTDCLYTNCKIDRESGAGTLHISNVVFRDCDLRGVDPAHTEWRYCGFDGCSLPPAMWPFLFDSPMPSLDPEERAAIEDTGGIEAIRTPREAYEAACDANDDARSAAATAAGDVDAAWEAWKAWDRAHPEVAS